MKRVARGWRLIDAAINRICILVRNLTSEFRTHCLGRRALQEIRFAKYRAVTNRDERDVRELALRRLERTALRIRAGS